MSLTKYINRIDQIDQLIRMKATGNPENFAEKLRLSKSMLMENLKELKELGAPIAYCSYRCTYYYISECKFKFGFDFDNP